MTQHQAFIGLLRKRLLIILLALVVPAGLLTARAYFTVRGKELDRVAHLMTEDALKAANALWAQVEVARNTIGVVKTTDWASSTDMARCDQFSRRIVDRATTFSNLSVFDSDGNYVCGSDRPASSINVSDRDWFQQVVRTGDFTISALLTGRFTGLPSIVFAKRLESQNGRPARIITVSTTASHVKDIIERLERKQDAVLTIVDHAGTIVARVPGHSDWAGRTLLEEAPLRLVRRAVPHATIRGTDDWLYHTHAVDKQGRLHAVVAAPAHAALSAINRMFLENIAIFAAVALVVGSLAWWAAERVVVRGVDNQLRKGLLSTITTLANAVEARDPYTAGHQTRVAHLAAAIGRALGLSADRLEGLRLGALIHDIGKLTVPTEILVKRERLTEDELRLIQRHSQAGYAIVKDVDFRWPIAEMIYQHHERFDGTGYPRGLKRHEIILDARILAVADVVEAITSPRPYRAALGVAAALEHIQEKAGTWFDPDVVRITVALFRDHAYQLPSPQLKEFPKLAFG